MLKKDDIILIKSYGNEKTKIFLRGVNEVLMIDASFEEVKFAINNDRLNGDILDIILSKIFIFIVNVIYIAIKFIYLLISALTIWNQPKINSVFLFFWLRILYQLCHRRLGDAANLLI